jgi:hypothetical protein
MNPMPIYSNISLGSEGVPLPSVVLREYPPSAMTANSTTLAAGTDSAGNAYGAGTYIFNYPFGTNSFTLFNKIMGGDNVGNLGSLYNGYYIGDFCNDTRTTFGTYFGSCTGTSNDRVWTFLSSSAPGISIDLSQDVNPNKYYGSTFTYTLPSPIYLQNLQLYTRGPYSTFIPQIPKSFRVYGMNIGDIGWTQIANYSNLNAWTSYTSASVSSNIIWDGATNAENLTFKINALTSYSIYGFVVNALIGTTNENFTLAEIKLFGTDYYVPASGQSGTITSGGKGADNTGGGGGGSQLNIIEPVVIVGESVPVVPVGITDYKYLEFTYRPTVIEQKTGVGGWRLVRFLPRTATAWHPVNDNLAGTGTYGTAYNDANAWSIPFGTYDEFVFGTLNLQYWMYITKSEAIGTNYSGIARNIRKSSFSSIQVPLILRIPTCLIT